MGSKIKVVVNFIYGYQNLSGEKYETNEKKLELNRAYQLREKSKKPPENIVFQQIDIHTSSLRCPGWTPGAESLTYALLFKKEFIVIRCILFHMLHMLLR